MPNAMTDRLLRDPAWWLVQACLLVLSYLLLRVPRIEQVPAPGELAPLWQLMAPWVTLPMPNAQIAALALTLLLALTWPALWLLASPWPQPDDPLFATPAGNRLLARQALTDSVQLILPSLAWFIPLCAMAVKSGEIALMEAIQLGSLPLLPALWIPSWIVVWRRLVPVRAVGSVALWVSCPLLTLLVLHPWSAPPALMLGELWAMHWVWTLILLVILFGFIPERGPERPAMAHYS